MSKKIEVNIEMKDLEGNVLTQETEDGETKTLTVKSVLVNALLHPRNEDENTTGDTKLARFNLAQAIHGAEDTVEIGNSDISMIKKLVTRIYSSLVVGQVYQLLDAKD